MATIGDDLQIRKGEFLWEWKIGPTGSPAASYTFAMPEQFGVLRIQADVTGDRTVTPTPFPATARDTDDPGDDVMSTTTATTRPVYMFQAPGRVEIDVGGSSGDVHISLQAFQ